MTRKRSVVAAITLFALTVMVATGAMSASAAKNESLKSTAHALVGSWNVTITLLNPPPGLPPVQRSLATFTRDGGTVESANAAPVLRGASHGAWERIGPNLFAVTRVFFRFNPQTGAYLGTQKVNATARVAPDGETFTAVSVSELRDPDGNVVLAGLRATAVATRIHAERIPDLPSAAAVTGPSSAAKNVGQAEDVRETERMLLRATVDADVAVARQLLADDFELINPLGIPTSREEYLGAIAAGELDFLTFEPASDIAVRVYGNAAVARYRSNIDLAAFGLRLTHQAWHTNLLERRHGRWQVVWAQTTAIPNNPALVIEALKRAG